MSKPNPTSSELDKWCVATRIHCDLVAAMDAAMEGVRKQYHVELWPVQQGQWLLIVRYPVLLN